MRFFNVLKRFLGTSTGKQNNNYSGQNNTTDRRYCDISETEWFIINSVEKYTMTSPERIVSLIRAVDYVERMEIEGAFVECGVWKGGSVMALMKRLIQIEKAKRKVWLYDTFEGMSEPTELDIDPENIPAKQRLENAEKIGTNIWAFSTLDEVKENLKTVGYPKDQIHFIQGKVEDTLPYTSPDKIAILRLDTDWYESTKMELEILYDKVSSGGVVIIDDYGHWKGCKKAVDEFIEKRSLPIFLHRIDYTARIFIKP